MILDRDTLLKPRPLNVKTVDVEGLDCVRIRQLSHSEATQWKRWQMNTEESLAELKLVSLCVVDENDKPILLESDLDALSKQPSTSIALLVYEVMVVNGFMRDVKPDEALKLFEASPERLFMCRLAAKLGIPKVDVLADSLTEDDLKEWKAVALLDGWFENEGWTNAVDVVDTFEAESKPDRFLTPDAALAHFTAQAV